MVDTLRLWLLRIGMGKGGELMMAMFFAQRVVLGKTQYRDVPEKIREKVKELLVDAGLAELAQE